MAFEKNRCFMETFVQRFCLLAIVSSRRFPPSECIAARVYIKNTAGKYEKCPNSRVTRKSRVHVNSGEKSQNVSLAAEGKMFPLERQVLLSFYKQKRKKSFPDKSTYMHIHTYISNEVH